MPKIHHLLLCALIPLALPRPSALAFEPAFTPLIDAACIDCHDADTDTPLNFETLAFDLDDPVTFRTWEKVYGQIHSGAMPPKDKPRPDPALQETATTALLRDLLAASRAAQRQNGRAPVRRLTPGEYEYTLHDLLGIGGDLASKLPPEDTSSTFDTIATDQGISPVHIRSYLAAAGAAIDEAIELGRKPRMEPRLIDYRNNSYVRIWFERELRRGGNTVLRADDAFVMFDGRPQRSPHTTQSNNMGIHFPAPGRYRIEAEAYAYQAKTPVTNFLRNGKRVGTLKGYSCQIVVNEALTWLDEKRDADEPFFLNLWFNEPHAPIAAPDEIVSQYGALDDQAAIYSGTIDNTDRAIGRLVAKLEKLGELDNTIIIYSSDNGSYRQERNGELRGKKGSLFEGGHRVPGIFYWKGGIPGGRVEDEPAGAVDLLPTLCGLIGIDKPGGVHLDGSDLIPMLTGSGKFERHRPLFWMAEANMVMRVGDHTLFASSTAKSPIDFKTADRLKEQIKELLGDDLEKELGGMDLRSRLFNGNMKFANPEANRLKDQHRDLYYFQEAWIPELKKGGIGRVQLYDLSKDLGQQNDIAKERPELVARLKKQAAAIYRSVMAEAPEWPTPEELAAAKKPQGNAPQPVAVGTSDSKNADLLARIDKNPLPPGYHGSRHQAYVDRVMAGLKPEQRSRVGQLWKEKRRLSPGMPNPGASFVKILTHVATGAPGRPAAPPGPPRPPPPRASSAKPPRWQIPFPPPWTRKSPPTNGAAPMPTACRAPPPRPSNGAKRKTSAGKPPSKAAAVPPPSCGTTASSSSPACAPPPTRGNAR